MPSPFMLCQLITFPQIGAMTLREWRVTSCGIEVNREHPTFQFLGPAYAVPNPLAGLVYGD